jgi:hypothetical protein
MVFAAPAVLLLAASGLPPILAWLRRVAPLAPALAVAIVLFPVGQAGYRVVCPWDRADSARAAAYVQAERRSGEVVFGTNWEHDYYFRHLASAYKALDRLGQSSRKRLGIGTSSPAAERLWLVAAGKKEERRERWLQDLTASGLWRVLERREFDQTTVFHLEFIRGGALLEQPGGQ